MKYIVRLVTDAGDFIELEVANKECANIIASKIRHVEGLLNLARVETDLKR